ncbi:capsular polysaccharide synthesis protein [Phenylobacterium sp.]|uniref:capsular polysaccharide synthesis protein n=1 Tax=Phenylobacterium sp. TaxID=1871053 RepID=UPI0035AF1609
MTPRRSAPEPVLNRTIWLLWLQGWDTAPWLIRQVAESWEINNPDWTVRYLSWSNLRDYVDDADYLFAPGRNISPQAVSDIVRVSLLNRHGGVWADATLLCMQPLTPWIVDAVRPAGLWMYHGHGGGMDARFGPASWFIASEAGGLIISRWKRACDDYWRDRRETTDYFWLDGLFKTLFRNDRAFRETWRRAPHLYVERPTQAHGFARGGRMIRNSAAVKRMLATHPPYVLKLWWKPWQAAFPEPLSADCRASNGYYALQMSKRRLVAPHRMDRGTSLAFHAEMAWCNALYFATRAIRGTGRRLLNTLSRSFGLSPARAT